MKVLVIGPIPPPFGGGEIMMKATLAALKLQGVELGHVNTSIRQFNKDRMKLNASALLAYFKIYWTIHRMAAKGNFSHIYFSLSKKPLAFLRNVPYIMIGRWHRLKVVGHIHGGVFDVLDHRWLMFFVRKVDSIIVLSTPLKELIASKLPNTTKVEMLLNGVEAEVAIEPKTKMKKILFIGNLVPSKGILRIAQIFSKLCKEYPSLELGLIGEWHSDEDRKHFYSLMEAATCERVVEHGYIPNQEVQAIIPNYDLLLHPTQYDGQPISIVEAQAKGLPVISTEIGGIPHMIDQGVNGRLINDVENIEAYCSVVRDLILNESKYQSMSAGAIEAYRSKFSLSAYGKGLYRIMSEVG